MNKSLILAVSLLFFLLIFMFPNVSATVGFGPAEMYVSNQVNNNVIGNATLINGDNVAKYGIFSIVMPYSDKDTYQIVESEIIHARVICKTCGESMQRWEAIPGYKYGDELISTCTKCGSNDLIFYDIMPRDEYEMFSIETAGNFHLEKIGHHTWRTVEKISPGGACNIRILYDASSSYLDENMHKHWEIHLRGTAVEEINGDSFMVGGIDLRILVNFKFPLHLEILDDIEKGKTFRVKARYGPPDQRWLKTPNLPITIDFNGIKEETNEEGIVTFTYPDTRNDYEYGLTALESDVFLSSSMTISKNTKTDGDTGGMLSFLNNFYIRILIIIAVIIVACLFILNRYFEIW